MRSCENPYPQQYLFCGFIVQWWFFLEWIITFSNFINFSTFVSWHSSSITIHHPFLLWVKPWIEIPWTVIINVLQSIMCFWCLNHLKFGQWTTLQGSFCFLPMVSGTRCFLCFSCPKPTISHFFRNLLLLWIGHTSTWFKSPNTKYTVHSPSNFTSLFIDSQCY